MRFHRARRWSFLWKFPFYLSLSGIVVILMLMLWGWQQYIIQRDRIAARMESQAEQLESVFNVDIEHTASLMNLMILQLQEQPDDIQNISNVMAKFRTNAQLDNHFAWTTFSWVDPTFHIVATSVYGIAFNGFDLSARDYLPLTRVTPGKLYVGQPVISPIYHRLIIPAGIGVVRNGHYVGTVTVGFDVATMSQHLRHVLSNEGFGFALLDQHNQVIASSSQIIPPISQVPSQSITPLSEKDSYQVVVFKNYPYRLAVIYNHQIAALELWQSLGSRILEIAIIGLLLLAVLTIVYYHIIRPLVKLSQAAEQITRGQFVRRIPHGRSYETINLALSLARLQRAMRRERTTHKQLAEALKIIQESDVLRDRFARRVSYEMKTPLQTIAKAIELLTLHQLGSLSTALTPEEELSYLRISYQSMLQLQTFISDEITLTSINPVILLQESIAIQSKAALNKHITMHQHFAPDLPMFVTDEIKFKQIITSLLTRILDFSPENITIEIAASMIIKDQESFLEITISDNGLGFDDTIRSHWRSRWEESGLGLRSDGTDFSPEMMVKLLEYLGGSIVYNDIPTKGSTVTVTFPIRQQENITSFMEYLSSTEGAELADMKQNIIQFQHYRNREGKSRE